MQGEGDGPSNDSRGDLDEKKSKKTRLTITGHYL